MIFRHLALASLALTLSSIGLATASGSPSAPQAEVPRPHAADFERFEQWLGNWEGTCVGHNRDGMTNTYPVKSQVRRTHGDKAISYQAQYQGEDGGYSNLTHAFIGIDDETEELTFIRVGGQASHVNRHTGVWLDENTWMMSSTGRSEEGIDSWRLIRTFEGGRTYLKVELAEGDEPFWTRWTFEESRIGEFEFAKPAASEEQQGQVSEEMTRLAPFMGAFTFEGATPSQDFPGKVYPFTGRIQEQMLPGTLVSHGTWEVDANPYSEAKAGNWFRFWDAPKNCYQYVGVSNEGRIETKFGSINEDGALVMFQARYRSESQRVRRTISTPSEEGKLHILREGLDADGDQGVVWFCTSTPASRQ
ncbi:hypothetical protein Poly30_08240 [Planctomycetes bacterium Poly30]|uniref:DUF1579 domain-containing protein n=1 Tax=Saltatorellus ferox TaxID=2528018 RepID=A0A518EML6_9BACT|nr:hypothetical protein Poly30_08240 [Planctomycetes bacterium Poly30]